MNKKRLWLGITGGVIVILIATPFSLIKIAENKLSNEKCFCTPPDTFPPTTEYYKALSYLHTASRFPFFSTRANDIADKHDTQAELCLFQVSQKIILRIKLAINDSIYHKKKSLIDSGELYYEKLSKGEIIQEEYLAEKDKYRKYLVEGISTDRIALYNDAMKNNSELKVVFSQWKEFIVHLQHQGKGHFINEITRNPYLLEDTLRIQKLQ